MRDIVLIPGDGIGPEVCEVAVDVVEATGFSVNWIHREAGRKAYERYSEVVPADTLDAVRQVGACLKGPSWAPSGGSRRSPNHYLRIGLDLYACLRLYPCVDRDGDIALVRENVEDLYRAIEWWAADGIAQAIKIATRKGCQRIATFACELARRRAGHVTVVHKANNLKLTEGLFLSTALEIAERLQVPINALLADTAASTAVLRPDSFDVVLANNTYGDFLSNVLAARLAGLGAIPSLNIGDGICVAEASHGDAQDLMGSGRADPTGLVLAAAALLEHLGSRHAATTIRAAVAALLDAGRTTPDRGGTATTRELGQELATTVRGLVGRTTARAGHGSLKQSGTTIR